MTDVDPKRKRDEVVAVKYNRKNNLKDILQKLFL